MACNTTYEDMMSLHLDGLLDDADEQHLRAHIEGCTICAPVWGALQEAHGLLVRSASLPTSVPSSFVAAVMQRVAASPVERPETVFDTEPAPSVFFSPRLSVLPQIGVPVPDLSGMDGYQILLPTDTGLAESFKEWQGHVRRYVQGIAAVSLALAVGTGVVLWLALSGAVAVPDALLPATELISTFFTALISWGSSLAASAAGPLVVAALLVFALLALGGWQLIANYQHVVSQSQGEAVAGEVYA